MKALKYQKKSLIKLEDLLRRRKSDLKRFIAERGITTYQSLDEICVRLGVKVPSLEAFEAAVPTYVSNPTEGVVVVPPLDVILESSGDREPKQDDFEAIPPTVVYEEEPAAEVETETDDGTSFDTIQADVKNSRKKMKRFGV